MIQCLMASPRLKNLTEIVMQWHYDSNCSGKSASATKVCCLWPLTSLQPTEVSVPFHELVFRDVRIKGSLICSRPEADRMLKTVAEHKISVKTNLFFGLREIPNLMELAQSGKMQGKAVVIIDEEELKRVKKGKTASSSST